MLVPKVKTRSFGEPFCLWKDHPRRSNKPAKAHIWPRGLARPPNSSNAIGLPVYRIPGTQGRQWDGQEKKSKLALTRVCVIVATSLDDTTELKFSDELLREVGKHLQQVLEDANESFLGRDIAVGLDANERVRDVGMRHCQRTS